MSVFCLPSWPPPTLPNTSSGLCTGSRWQPYSKAEYVQNRATENRAASKLAFYSSGMAATSGGVNSSLIHLVLYSFCQELVFLHISLLSSQWRGDGREEFSGEPFQQEGTRIPANLWSPGPALSATDQITSFSQEELGSSGCGVGFSRPSPC